MTPETLAEVLEELLVKAEQAHAAHPEVEWPPFYADRLAAVLGTEFTLEQLTTALREASVAHGVYEDARGEGRDEQWARWYAQHMAGALSHDWYRWLAEAQSWEL